jgi:cytochrome c-type biogenesis protein CcmH
MEQRGGAGLALVTALIVPLLALGVYSQVGAPALPDLPQAERLASAEKDNDLEALVYKVEQHLAKNPGDASGWEILLPSYQSMGRYGDAAEALRRIIAISGPTADRYADLAEMLMFKGQGLMPAEGVEAARAALALDAKHSKARYFYALALEQDGKRTEALGLLEQLLADTPTDAPWRASVEKQINALKSAPATSPSSAPQPTPEQVAAASAMPAADQQEMIRGMVDGLAEKLKANPNDLQGWLRLIRARIVLNEADSARAALETARATFAADQGALDQLLALAKELEGK